MEFTCCLNHGLDAVRRPKVNTARPRAASHGGWTQTVFAQRMRQCGKGLPGWKHPDWSSLHLPAGSLPCSGVLRRSIYQGPLLPTPQPPPAWAESSVCDTGGTQVSGDTTTSRTPANGEDPCVPESPHRTPTRGRKCLLGRHNGVSPGE